MSDVSCCERHEAEAMTMAMAKAEERVETEQMVRTIVVVIKGDIRYIFSYGTYTNTYARMYVAASRRTHPIQGYEVRTYLRVYVGSVRTVVAL